MLGDRGKGGKLTILYMCDSTFLGAILLYFIRTFRASVVSSLVRTWWYQGHETLRDPSGTGRSSIFAIANILSFWKHSKFSGSNSAMQTSAPPCGFVHRQTRLRRSVTCATIQDFTACYASHREPTLTRGGDHGSAWRPGYLTTPLFYSIRVVFNRPK